MNAREAVLTVALLGLCCALPILVLAGVSVGAGVILGKIALVALGLGGIGFAAHGAARGRRGLAVAILTVAGIVATAGIVLTARLAGRPPSTAEAPLPVATTGASTASADRLPAFSLPALGGGTFSAADLEGKPAVVNFFASWCSSCWAEIPHIQGAFQDHKAQGLQVLGIGVLDSEDSLRWMVDKLRITYPTVYDANGETVTKILQLRSMPTTLFVDRQGIVRARWQGFLDEETLRRLIARIL